MPARDASEPAIRRWNPAARLVFEEWRRGGPGGRLGRDDGPCVVVRSGHEPRGKRSVVQRRLVSSRGRPRVNLLFAERRRRDGILVHPRGFAPH